MRIGPEVRPRVLLSQCLELRACRYDGQCLHDPVMAVLLPWIDPLPVCPEEAVGLGTPRDPLRLVRHPDGDHMVQPSTGIDVTPDMVRFSHTFLNGLREIDGVVLKSRSPSCGIRDTKIFPGKESSSILGRGAGLFAREVKRVFPGIPLEDEQRLHQAAIRDHFFTALFTRARLRQARSQACRSALADFHHRHRLLFLTANQRRTHRLDRLVAPEESRSPAAVFRDYDRELAGVFARRPRLQSQCNTLELAFRSVSKRLSREEVRRFREEWIKVSRGTQPVTGLRRQLASWLDRYDVSDLRDQVYFRPYPRELEALPATGEGMNA
ncbi:MAG: DUF1722 domain-containing protein [Candidatus Neomarinimicrobiota bacterium]|nr:MAG: DUF1722 domain-containing protein [Candidatus Neomarinimicrobiota bacterium]